MKVNNFLQLSIIFLLIGCSDVIEKDISTSTIEIIFPLTNTEIKSNIANFQWNNLKGTENYRLQIYDLNQAIILDSLVNKTNLTYPLPQGNYKWKVRGENFAYQSAYSILTPFSVTISTDLTNQQTILSSPQDNLYVNNASVTFSWKNLSAATSYNVELINTTTGGSAYTGTNIVETTLSLNSSSLNKDAKYQWKVKAINSSSETAFTSRTLYLDTVSPNQPQNTFPANNSIQIINQQIVFTWINLSDSGIVQSPITNTLEIASEANFTTILQATNVSTSTLSQTFTNSGIYFWRITAKDLAGNKSASSPVFKFTIN